MRQSRRTVIHNARLAEPMLAASPDEDISSRPYVNTPVKGDTCHASSEPAMPHSQKMAAVVCQPQSTSSSDDIGVATRLRAFEVSKSNVETHLAVKV